jgi:hypothetical protein
MRKKQTDTVISKSTTMQIIVVEKWNRNALRGFGFMVFDKHFAETINKIY